MRAQSLAALLKEVVRVGSGCDWLVRWPLGGLLNWS